MNKKTTQPSFIGPSSDGRTNRWSITCPSCENRFEPITTMKRFQDLVCSKCKASMLAHYNEEPPFVELLGENNK